MPIQAGLLRHRVTIQQVTHVEVAGGTKPSLTTFATRWAEFMPVRGTDKMEIGIEKAEQLAKFRMRYTAGITPAMKLSAAGATWDIEDVSDLRGRKRETIITAVHRLKT